MPTVHLWVCFQTRFKYYANCREVAKGHAYLVSKMGRGTLTSPECPA